MILFETMPKSVQNSDLTLHLIKEELKSRKFFNVLRTVGLDDAFYQADLYSPILEHFELNDDSNETLDFYYALFEKYSVTVEANENSLTRAALDVYAELVEEKKRRARL
jgi:hypothetical protein